MMANFDLDKILNAESPLRWEPLLLDENIHEMDLEVVPTSQFSFMNFVDKLIRCYNAYDNKNITKAMEIIENVEMVLMELRNEYHIDSFLSRIKDAVNHVVYATKAILFMKNGEHEACLKVFKHVKNFNDFNDVNKAAIYAIRSACMALYSYDGTRVSVDFINIATKKDPSCAYWAFLKGFYLFKLRRIQNPYDSPSLEEREIFEKINEQEKDQPLFMVHLADVFRETAMNSKKKEVIYFWFMPEMSAKIDLKDKIDGMCELAKKYYEKSYKLRPECPFVAFRCAFGLMKLPTRYQNAQLAKNILNDIAPKFKDSGYGHFVLAFYYEMFAKNVKMAEQHLETAVKLNVFNALIHSIAVRHFCEEKFDAVKELEEMLETFKETPKKAIILSQLISHYIFEKLDIKLACEYTVKYFKQNEQSNCLQRHRSCFIKTKEPISLIDVVTDEVKYALANKDTTPELNKYLTQFVHTMNFASILVLKGKPQNLRTKFMEEKLPSTSPWYPNQPRNNENLQNFKQEFNQSIRGRGQCNPNIRGRGRDNQNFRGRGQVNQNFYGRGQGNRNFRGRGKDYQNIHSQNSVTEFQQPRSQYQNREMPQERPADVEKPYEEYQKNHQEKRERPMGVGKQLENSHKSSKERNAHSMKVEKYFSKDTGKEEGSLKNESHRHANSRERNADSTGKINSSKDMGRKDGSLKNESHRRQSPIPAEGDRYQKGIAEDGSLRKGNRHRESARRKRDPYYDYDRHRRHSSHDRYRHRTRSRSSSSDSVDYEKRRRSGDRRSRGRRRHDGRKRYDSYDSESDFSRYSSRDRYYSPSPRRRHRRTPSRDRKKSHYKRYERVHRRSPKYRSYSVSSISSERSTSRESYRMEDRKKREKGRPNSYEHDELLARKMRSMKVDDGERQNDSEIRGIRGEEKGASRTEKKSRKKDQPDRSQEFRNDHARQEKRSGVTESGKELRRIRHRDGIPSAESENEDSNDHAREKKRSGVTESSKELRRIRHRDGIPSAESENEDSNDHAREKRRSGVTESSKELRRIRHRDGIPSAESENEDSNDHARKKKWSGVTESSKELRRIRHRDGLPSAESEGVTDSGRELRRIRHRDDPYSSESENEHTSSGNKEYKRKMK